MKKIILTLIVSLITIKNLSAQLAAGSINDSSIWIEGIVIDSISEYNSSKKIASLRFSISTCPANSIIAPSTKYVVEVTYNKPFKLVIPSSSVTVYMSILGIGGLWNSHDNVYMLEKGDKIKCELSNSRFEFSGKGSDKLNCLNEIFRCSYLPKKQDLKYRNGGDYENAFLYESKKNDSVLFRRLSILSHYSAKLGKNMTEVINANCYGMRYYSSFRAARMFDSRDFRLFNAFKDSEAYTTANTKLLNEVDHTLLARSPIYCDYLFEKIRVENITFVNEKRVNLTENMPQVYQVIKTKYQGILRDKLLTLFFLNYKGNGTSGYLDDALQTIEDESYREILNNIKETRGKELPFFPFELKDERGKIVRLSDFNNTKILVLDFWYTGCINCIKLTNELAPVYEKYRDNPDVKFLSICVDRDKAMWLKSIAEGKYTHNESINLYAGGKGSSSESEHPLIRNYSITGYPTLFVVRDGKMFESQPEKSNLKLISLLESVLNNN